MDSVFIASAADPEKVAAAIRDYTSKGRTQRQLAREAGISDVSVSNYLAGLRRPSNAVLVRLAAALGVNPLDLLAD